LTESIGNSKYKNTSGVKGGPGRAVRPVGTAFASFEDEAVFPRCQCGSSAVRSAGARAPAAGLDDRSCCLQQAAWLVLKSEEW